MQDVIFTTKSLHPRDRFSYWHEVACKIFVEHDCQPADHRSFEAEVRSASLGTVQLSVYRNKAMTVRRNERQAARATADTIFACLQISGASIISQDGRDVIIEDGSFALIDTQRPYECKFSEESEQLVAQISRRELEARIGDTSQMMAHRVSAEEGVGRLASQFMCLLATRVESLPEPSRAPLAIQAVDLLALALKSSRPQMKRLSSARMNALLRLKNAIEKQMSDSEVTCEQVARSAGMSVRYANQLLATEATSLERHIGERRLERCRRAFDDREQDARTITEIALAWGFGDPSQFGRLFKAKNGLTPRDYRARSRLTR